MYNKSYTQFKGVCMSLQRSQVAHMWLKYSITFAVEVKDLQAVPRESQDEKGHLHSAFIQTVQMKEGKTDRQTLI